MYVFMMVGKFELTLVPFLRVWFFFIFYTSKLWFFKIFQAYPLDLNSDDFYSNRREAIDARLKEIENWNPSQLEEFAVQRFEKSLGISGNMFEFQANWYFIT